MADPDKISDYEVTGVLGRGGMGVVYEAVHAHSRAVAAVKTVRMASPSTIESIQREIVMLRELHHPGVVSIVDHGVADGTPWYAMELLRGRTLRDDLRAWFSDPGSAGAGPRDAPAWSITHVATVFRRLCEPLAYVHGQGVIHKDLSPANVFLVGDDRPVLFDFGLAARRARPTGAAREILELGGAPRGTAHYMAPEQARGQAVDARADVYALGCMLYEALCGRPPFLGDSAAAVLMQHVCDEPSPPSRVSDRVPAALDELVLRMLAKSPRDRIGYVEGVASALESIGAPIDAAAAAELGGRAPRPRAYTYRPGLAGRGDLVTALDDRLVELIGGRGGCACLVGESGVGKTRLAAEIAARAGELGIHVIGGECEQHAPALHPLRAVLRAAADRCRAGGHAETVRLLGSAGGVLAAYEPALAKLVPPLDETALPSAAVRHRVIAVLRDLVAGLAADAPLLIVLDDVQWADELTLAFLVSANELFDAHPVFVLVTARAEELTAEVDMVLRGLAASRHPVPRLDRESVGAMVRDMLALDDDVPQLTDFVAARSAGNPLFAAEYVRIAVDEGVVHRDVTGRWRLSDRSGSYDRLPTPGSIQALVRQKLVGLSAPARELVFAAAVIGRPASADLLARTAGLASADARRALGELMRRHVAEEASGDEIQLAHDTLREQVYDELTAVVRARMHGAAADAIERSGSAGPRSNGASIDAGGAGSQLAPHYAELAHHCERAGDARRALDYTELAAEHALATAAYGDARALLAKLLATEPAVAIAPTRRARWERCRGEACFALGDLATSARHLRASLALLDRPLPTSRPAWAATIARGVAGQLTRAVRGRHPGGVERPELVEAALAVGRMASCYFFDDDSLGVIGASLAAVNLAERAGDRVPVAELYANIGYVAGLARLGRVATHYFGRARGAARANRDRFGLGKALFTDAAWRIGIGDWDGARTAGAAGLANARELRDAQEAEIGLTILGHVAFATGDYAGSRRYAVELYESARARANAQHEAWGVYTQARASLYEGAVAAAVADFDRAMVMVERGADHASLILCGGMRAIALARAGDLARARVAADATTARIGDKTPPVFTIAEGFVGAAEAYLELWRCTGDPTLAAPARVAIGNLARLARMFPIAVPAMCNARGVWHARRGARRRATTWLQRGLARAEALHMPYDVAVARAALAAT